MPGRCLDIACLSRYAHRNAEVEEVVRVERHVRSCSRCRDKLNLMRHHAERLFDAIGENDPQASAACPSSIQLQHFGREKLIERQMVRIQEHVRSCVHCWEQLVGEEAARVVRPSQEMFATRAPDVDVRFAREGFHVVGGPAALLPSHELQLNERLNLSRRWRLAPASSRRKLQLLHRSHGDDAELWVRLELSSPEAFSLEIDFPGGPVPRRVWVWNRTRAWHCRAGRRGWTPGELLEPGYYFMGSNPHDVPWFALTLESDLLSQEALVWIAFEHCVHGRFLQALEVLASCRLQAPRPRASQAMWRAIEDFRRRWDLKAGHDGISFVEGKGLDTRSQPKDELEALPRIDLRQFDWTQGGDELIRLLQGLRAEAEASDIEQPRWHPHRLRRTGFRNDYEDLMCRLENWLPDIEASPRRPGESVSP